MPDDNEETPPRPEEEEAPEQDPRDARIAELEAALAAATSQVDAMSQALFTAQVAATGALLDPAALPYDPVLIKDPAGLQAAIATLLAASPWLAKLKVTGNVDQVAGDEVTPPAMNLMSILKEFTG